MKTRCLFSLLLLAVGSLCYADIQDPPANDYGPTRKLGRGLSNILFGWSEIPYTIASVNEEEGNSTAAGFGVVKGVGRSFRRFGTGIYEVMLFPFPVHHGSYRVPYRSDIPWIHGGMAEFPPELGFETKYRYSRTY